MGIVEQMSIIMAEHPPCMFSTTLSISSSTVTCKTTRPSNFSGSSAFDNKDTSVSCNRDANSVSKPLKGLPVNREMWLGCIDCRALSNVCFTSEEAFPSTWEVSISLPGFIGGKGQATFTVRELRCEFYLLATNLKQKPKSCLGQSARDCLVVDAETGRR